jgi:hypothetical protein
LDGMITPRPDQGTPVFDGRITAGRKGIPYDLTRFSATTARPEVDECAERDSASIVGEPVLVAA